MSTPDFFRSRLDAMIDLRHPLAVLTTRVRHQLAQVVDLYRGEPLGCHYNNGNWVS